MAATPARETTTPPPPPPPPVIGKAGRYTVFITPPANPRPPPEKTPSESPLTLSPKPTPVHAAPMPGKTSASVQVPPPQFEKPAAKRASSVFGFLWDAAAKVQNAHASLDEFLADWLGLNQSKYQWALNDYYENTGSGKDCGKPKELVSKDQTV